MPQEFLGVRCFNPSCEMFQVTQKKKTNKWQCRICHSKQSLKKIYAQSYKAKDVRQIIMQYNMDAAKRKEKYMREAYSKQQEYEEEEEDDDDDNEEQYEKEEKPSKWNIFIEPEDESSEEENEICITTQLPHSIHKKKGRRRYTKSNYKKDTYRSSKKMNGSKYSTKAKVFTKTKKISPSHQTSLDSTRIITSTLKRQLPKNEKDNISTSQQQQQQQEEEEEEEEVISKQKEKKQRIISSTEKRNPSKWDKFLEDKREDSSDSEEWNEQYPKIEEYTEEIL